MEVIALLLLSLFLQPAPDPRLTARWDSSTSATVSWSQSARACLYAKAGAVFVGCYDGVGRVVVELGHEGPMDGALRPMAGEVYVLQSAGRKTRADLRGRAVWFPVFRG